MLIIVPLSSPISLCLLLNFPQQVPFLLGLESVPHFPLTGATWTSTGGWEAIIWARVTYQWLHHWGYDFPSPATVNCLVGPLRGGVLSPSPLWWNVSGLSLLLSHALSLQLHPFLLANSPSFALMSQERRYVWYSLQAEKVLKRRALQVIACSLSVSLFSFLVILP